MNKKNKFMKQFIILGGLIIVMILYLLVSNGNKTHYQIPELNPVKKGEISKIEIIKSDETLVLIQKDNKWLIESKGYVADETKVSAMLDNIAELDIRELISRSKNYARYGLDKDQKITIKAYDKSNLIREFEVGKVASTYRHTFVKLTDNPAVYNARTSFRDNFDKKIDDIRDKKVLSFDQKEINAIHITEKDKTVAFNKKVDAKIEPVKDDKEDKEKKQEKQAEEYWIKDDGQRGNKTEVETIISELSNLSCDSYIEGKTKADFSAPEYRVVLTGAKEYSVSFFGKDKDNKYQVTTSESPYPFLLSEYKAERIQKKISDLEKKEEEKK